MNTTELSLTAAANHHSKVFALIILEDLYSRKGAAVSVNVRRKDAKYRLLGATVKIGHAALPKNSVAVTAETDQALVAQLLGAVKEREARAEMVWDADEYSWFIYVPRQTA